jgi:hypothetical protein
MGSLKKRRRANDPAKAQGQSNEKAIEDILRDADLKKFDPELERAIHPPKNPQKKKP